MIAGARKATLLLCAREPCSCREIHFCEGNCISNRTHVTLFALFLTHKHRHYYESLGENIAAAVRASVPFELKFGCADSFFRYASLLVLHRESCSRASLAFCCWLKKSIHARQDCLIRRGTVSAFPSFLLRVLKRALRATQSTLET